MHALYKTALTLLLGSSVVGGAYTGFGGEQPELAVYIVSMAVIASIVMLALAGYQTRMEQKSRINWLLDKQSSMVQEVVGILCDMRSDRTQTLDWLVSVVESARQAESRNLENDEELLELYNNCVSQLKEKLDRVSQISMVTEDAVEPVEVDS